MENVTFRGLTIGSAESVVRLIGVAGIDDYDSNAAVESPDWLHGGWPTGGFMPSREITLDVRLDARWGNVREAMKALKRAFQPSPTGIEEFPLTFVDANGESYVVFCRCVGRAFPLTNDFRHRIEGSIRLLASDPRLYSLQELSASIAAWTPAVGTQWDLTFPFSWAQSANTEGSVHNMGGFSTWPRFEITVGQDIINLNHDFENGLTGWQGPDSLRSNSSDFMLSGSSALKVVPNGVDALAQGFTPHQTPVLYAATPGQLYSAEAWSYTPDGWHDVGIVLDFRDDDNVSVGTAVSPVKESPAGTWTKHTASGVAPVGATQVRLFLRHGDTPTAADVMYWDDAKIVRGELEGTITNPRIENLNDGSIIDLSADGGLDVHYNQLLVVETVPANRNITLDGTPRWNNLREGSRFRPLEPGETTFRLRAEGDIEGATLHVYWRHAEL